ncbi:hypothetical protein JW887_02990 [Candidatus Dojkabacteria bacterium]|nr:hypothetical protein [Candidatus Dojkabacteria bacterium]
MTGLQVWEQIKRLKLDKLPEVYEIQKSIVPYFYTNIPTGLLNRINDKIKQLLNQSVQQTPLENTTDTSQNDVQINKSKSEILINTDIEDKQEDKFFENKGEKETKSPNSTAAINAKIDKIERRLDLVMALLNKLNNTAKRNTSEYDYKSSTYDEPHLNENTPIKPLPIPPALESHTDPNITKPTKTLPKSEDPSFKPKHPFFDKLQKNISNISQQLQPDLQEQNTSQNQQPDTQTPQFSSPAPTIPPHTQDLNQPNTTNPNTPQGPTQEDIKKQNQQKDQEQLNRVMQKLNELRQQRLVANQQQ